MFKLRNNNRGYTVVELLAVTAIIVVMAGLIAGALASTLRGGSKTRITSDVSQNGNFALSVISNTIINSESVTSIGGNSISDCINSPSGSSITLKQSDASLLTFSCTSNNIASQSANFSTTYLIDSDNLEVDAASCSFRCRQENGDPLAIPIIDVSFTLNQKGSSGTFETKSSALFSTSTSMRNYNPK